MKNQQPDPKGKPRMVYNEQPGSRSDVMKERVLSGATSPGSSCLCLAAVDDEFCRTEEWILLQILFTVGK